MSGDEWLPEEWWTKLEVSGLLKERSVEEKAHLNTSFSRGFEVLLEYQRG